MANNEKIKNLISRQKKLLVELKEEAPRRYRMSELSQHLFDLRLGECIGYYVPCCAIVRYLDIPRVIVPAETLRFTRRSF